MTTSHVTPGQSQNKNCFLWGCLIVLVLMCLVIGCLASIVGLAFAGIDLLGIDLEESIENFIPWQDFLDDPSYIPDFSDFFFDEDDGSVEIINGPCVMKSFSYCLNRTTNALGAGGDSIQFLDGAEALFSVGTATRVGTYPSYGSVNIPGAGMRFKTSLNVKIIAAVASGSTVRCYNFNVEYQR